MPVPRRSSAVARRAQCGAVSWRSPRPWIALLVGGVLLVLAAVALLLAWAVPKLPPIDAVTDYQPLQPLTVLTSDGVEIGQFGAERRVFLPLAQVPKALQDAVLAIEDQRFYDHAGIDLRGIARALAVKLGGGRWQGASTITQQVARNILLTHRRTAERKLKEALLALRIEQALSKDQILERYLNQIYLGQRAYGFGAAAQVYFGKPLAELSLAEHALLAGLPKNPNFANPVVNLSRAQQRQRLVLGAMLAQGRITRAAHDAAVAQTLQIRREEGLALHAEHVAEMARLLVVERFGEDAYKRGYKVYTTLVSAEQAAAWAAVRSGLLAHERRQPWRGPEAQEELPDADGAHGAEGDSGGNPGERTAADAAAERARAAAAQALEDHADDDELRVAVVLDATPKAVSVQLASGEQVALTGAGLKLAQRGLRPNAPEELALRRGAIVRVRLEPGRGGQPGTWSLAQWPGAEGAFVSLEASTGRVHALVGGYDFSRQPFNHATQAWRQPGSAFKPFLYSAALERGITPATLVADAPLDVPEGDGSDAWQPQNADGEYDGALTLRQALARSKNTVSVRLLQHIGIGTVRDWSGRFGLDPERQPTNLTLALGAGATTPWQLAGAYAVFANGGLGVTPRVIDRVTDAEGKVLYESPAPAAPDARRVVTARNAFVMRRLLQEVVTSGTAARARRALPRADLGGKTGTTNDAVDAWFAGFQPDLVGVAWVGYDEPRSLGSRETGGGLALPIWAEAMKVALAKVPVAKDRPPEGVTQRAGEWIYAELVDGGAVDAIGLEDLDALSDDWEAPFQGDLPAGTTRPTPVGSTMVFTPAGASAAAAADAPAPMLPAGPLPPAPPPTAAPPANWARPQTGGARP